MTWTELLSLARGLPWLAGGLAVLGITSWVVERVAGLSGPATALHRLWADRELRALRREAQVRAERRRLERTEESEIIADLRAQVAELSAEVARLRATTRAAETSTRQVKDWADTLLRAARAAGLTYADPPRTGEQVAVAALGSRNPAQQVPAPR